MPWKTCKKNSNTISERWKGNWPDWQVCLKTWQFILKAHHPYRINESFDHSSIPRAICHVKLIAPTCGNQRSQLCLQARPRRPPFPKWYDVNIRCDYHFGVRGHSIEDCTIFKNKVQNLIEEGKLKFEKSDGPTEVEYSSRAKGEGTRKTPKGEGKLKWQDKRNRPQERLFLRKLQCQRRRYPLPKLEEVEQAPHWPLKDQKNVHASQTRSKEKIHSRVWLRV